MEIYPTEIEAMTATYFVVQNQVFAKDGVTTAILFATATGTLRQSASPPHMPRDKAAIIDARERIMLARITELQADAERYRWLKLQPQSWMMEYMKQSRPLGRTLDAAIDYAKERQRD